MKNTKDNVVKLLRALEKQSLDLARIMERYSDDKQYSNYMSEAIAYDRVISSLTDQKYFSKLCEIMKLGDD